MFFSIVIPLFNKEREIESTIKSVLQQSHRDFELLVIDDGSTDKSYDIVNSIHDDRLFILKKANGGVSSARNHGIAHARYNYIAFLDSDDLWDVQYLEYMEMLITQFPKCGMYSSLYSYLNHGQVIFPKFPILKSDQFLLIENYYEASKFAPIITSSTAIIPRKVFTEMGSFNESLTHGEDLDMWLRISFKYNLAICNKYLAFYRLCATNRGCNRVPVYSNSIISILDECEIESSNKFYSQYLNKIRLDFLSQYLHSNDKFDYLSARKKLKIITIKSFVFKVAPFNFLRLQILFIKWWKEKKG